jgi:hypothetical protein
LGLLATLGAKRPIPSILPLSFSFVSEPLCTQCCKEAQRGVKEAKYMIMVMVGEIQFLHASVHMSTLQDRSK